MFCHQNLNISLGLDASGQYPAAIAEDVDQADHFVLTVFAIDKDGTSPNNEVIFTQTEYKRSQDSRTDFMTYGVTRLLNFQITYSKSSDSPLCFDNDMFEIDPVTGKLF